MKNWLKTIVLAAALFGLTGVASAQSLSNGTARRHIFLHLAGNTSSGITQEHRNLFEYLGFTDAETIRVFQTLVNFKITYRQEFLGKDMTDAQVEALSALVQKTYVEIAGEISQTALKNFDTYIQLEKRNMRGDD